MDINFSTTHPELKEEEIFLTNTKIENYKSIGYKSKRLGNIAYTIHGEETSKLGCTGIDKLFPVFVSKKEYEENVKRHDQV